jgi:hypothetical protein
VAGPRVLDLYVRQPGFFGVYLDEVADMNGRTNICVRAIEPGSDAHKQCPQLEPGMYVHTVNRRAVGGMHANAVTAMLRTRPLAMTFAYTTEDVDMAAAQQTALVLEYPCDVTFHTPVGEPLGIIFGEYPSRHVAHCAPPARPSCLPCMPCPAWLPACPARLPCPPARLPACPACAAWCKAATVCLYWLVSGCCHRQLLCPHGLDGQRQPGQPAAPDGGLHPEFKWEGRAPPPPPPPYLRT